MPFEWVAILLMAAVVIWIIVAFNKLVALRNRVQNGWAEVDIQLKRRHDLIPNLVEAARGYMQHERSVFEEVSQARAQAVQAGSNVQQRSAAESALTAAIGNLFAVVENYPQLRAADNLMLLQEQLTSTENRIAYARQFYNEEVMQYNTTQLSFPRNLIAGLLGFSTATLFTAAEADRANVAVKVS